LAYFFEGAASAPGGEKKGGTFFLSETEESENRNRMMFFLALKTLALRKSMYAASPFSYNNNLNLWL